MINYNRNLKEIFAEFNAQIHLLKKSCAEYDFGDELEAKRIALALRILLHTTRNSKSLFAQLNLNRHYVICSSGSLYTPSNLVSSITLLQMQIANQRIDFQPFLSDFASPRTFYLEFEDWWNEIIIDDKRSYLSRKDVVLHIANTDGGAHVDPILKRAYADLVKMNSLGFSLNIDGKAVYPTNNVAYATVRQIAFEFIQSLTMEKLKFNQFHHADRKFEMRFVDSERRFKWSRTDLTFSAETSDIIDKFTRQERFYYIFKLPGQPTGVEVLLKNR